MSFRRTYSSIIRYYTRFDWSHKRVLAQVSPLFISVAAFTIFNSKNNKSYSEAGHKNGSLVPYTISNRAICLEKLSTVLKADQIDTNIEECILRGKPWNSYHKIASNPEAVIFPETTEDVSAIMKICTKYRIPGDKLDKV